MNLNWSQIVDVNAAASTFLKAVATRGPKLLLVLFLIWAAVRLANLMAGRIEKALLKKGEQDGEAQRARTLSGILFKTAKAAIYLVGGSTALQSLGIEITAIVASVGVVGLALGFGAQSLVKDVINGFFLILEDQYRVGDVVRVAGIRGQVETITLRETVLRDVEGTVHYIPNGQVDIVSNLTKEWSRALLRVGVAYKENVDEVMKELRKICDGLRTDPTFGPMLLEDFEIPGVEELGDSSVVVQVMVKTRPLKQWDVMREMRRRIKNRFDEAGIEIPFPQRTVWVMNDRKD